MINYHKELVAALNTIGIGVHYELSLTADTKTPCISYQERNNYIREAGNTLCYSVIVYTITVWGNDLAAIQENSLKVDNVLRPLGWKRTSSQELHDINSTIIRKIMTYECLALEQFN